MPEENGFRMLVVGAAWPPETFLSDLLAGLAKAGVEITAASHVLPSATWPPASRVRWLRTPSWEGPISSRAYHLGRMALHAVLRARTDVSLFAPYVRGTRGSAERLRIWNQLLPFAGGRWNAIYFPWNSAAIAHRPLFDLGCPVVISCRGSQINSAPHNPARAHMRNGLETTFRRATAVHCVSEDIKQEACRYGLDPAKAWVIRRGVDAAVFHPSEASGMSNGVFHVTAVGRLTWIKGYEYALQAVRRLADRGINVGLSIVGDGPDRQRVLFTIRDLGIEGRVSLLGHMTPGQVARQLQRSDAFVLSSLSEGLSGAVLEAMSCGLPVVSTDCGGMREAITDGVEGFLAPPRAAEAMADALERLAEDPGLRRSMGAAARARALREFSLQRHVEQWLALLRSVGAGAPTARAA